MLWFPFAYFKYDFTLCYVCGTCLNEIRLSMSNETKINVVRFKTNPTNFYLPFIELALSTFVDYNSFLWHSRDYKDRMLTTLDFLSFLITPDGHLMGLCYRRWVWFIEYWVSSANVFLAIFSCIQFLALSKVTILQRISQVLSVPSVKRYSYFDMLRKLRHH